jgi:hypothetical protein
MFKEIIKVFKGIKDKTKDNFSIEHHLKSDRYYPLFCKMFLIRNNITQNIDTVERYMYPYALFYKTKEEAINCIKEYKNQQALEKVETIEIN